MAAGDITHSESLSSSTFDAEKVHNRPKFFDFILNIPGNYVAWWDRYARWEMWPYYAGALGSTAVLTATDNYLIDPWVDSYNRSSTVHFFGEAGIQTGDGKWQFGIAALFALTGTLANNDRAFRTGIQVAESILTTGIVVQIMKRMTGRESPNMRTQRTGRWKPFPNLLEYQRHVASYDAVPSGHVATALSTAQVIIENYPEQTWIPLVGYPIVAITGLGMAATNNHWWSDYPIAVVLGYSFAKVVTRNNYPKEKKAITHFQIQPFTPRVGSVGALLSWEF